MTLVNATCEASGLIEGIRGENKLGPKEPDAQAEGRRQRGALKKPNMRLVPSQLEGCDCTTNNLSLAGAHKTRESTGSD